MLFNSYEFIFSYLPITFFGFFLLARFGHMLAKLWLTAASVFFYAWWSPKYTALMLGSIVINFIFGIAIGRSTSQPLKQVTLAAAVTFDLGLLAYYKYANFFISTINAVSGNRFSALDVLLPIGISFFTFTQIAFLVDVYKREAKEYDFTSYVLFVTFFPHLIAGPILHHKEMMPQFASPNSYRLRLDDLTIGTTIFAIGLAKKIIMADGFSGWASPVFDSVAAGFHPTIVIAWVGALAYTFQIYFDFSGYSDMAIGLARLFGIKLPLNFNSPYKAINIAEFWRRWHMTLSRFLRDYLYIPLGGSRFGGARRYRNLLVTMLLGGMWHGANLTFLLWGGLHGIYLIIYHIWNTNSLGRSNKRPHSFTCCTLAWGVTFLAVVVAWVVFRAPTVASALEMLRGMAGLNGLTMPRQLGELAPSLMVTLEAMGVKFSPAWAKLTDVQALGSPIELAVLAPLTLCILLAPNTQQLMSRYEPALGVIFEPRRSVGLGWATGALIGVLLTICLMSINKHSEFLYFQF